jgi:hypothetical protein
MRDFEAFYAAGIAANRGDDPYGRAIWKAEMAVPGVDTSHNETLPFVGPPAGLPLWRALARLPYDVAGRVWGASLALAFCVLLFGSLFLARAPERVPVLLGATVLGAASGPLISDVSLGQVALVCVAGVVAALLLLPTRAWLLAAAAAASAALAPNLAIVLIARLTDPRAVIAFGIAALGTAALMLQGQGLAGVARYLHLLSVHGAAEAATAIQITPSSLAVAFGTSTATFVRVFFAVVALGLTLVGLRRIAEPALRIGIASCALPFVVPFFHEHDFVLMLLPAIVCAIRARTGTLALSAIAATATGIDWLGLAQRPPSEPQAIVLAFAGALGFMLAAELRRESFAALVVPLAVAAVSLLARAHSVPIWPDALPPHWQPPAGASVSEVWGLEQRAVGLDAANPVWDLLRALSLGSCALLGFATYLTAKQPRLDVDVHEVVERREDTRIEILERVRVRRDLVFDEGDDRGNLVDDSADRIV